MTMKLKNALDAYYEHSKALSTINRQLALSGIAVIWFFVHPQNSNNCPLNFGIFKWSFIFFSTALCCDLLHYASATVIWGTYHHYKEKRIAPDLDFEAPNWLNWFPIAMMWLKVSFTVVGYIFLIYSTKLL